MENATTLNPNATDTSEDIDSFLWVNYCELVLGIIGTLGNGLVCLIILLNSSMKTMTNYFILSLAVTDFVTSFSLIFNRFVLATVTIQVPSGLRGELYCRLWNSQLIFWVSIKASVFNLVAVTMERYFAIVYPLSYEERYTRTRAWIIVAIVWIVALITEIVFPFFHFYKAETGTCNFAWPNETVAIFLGVFSFLATYALPLVIMAWAYYVILHNLKQSTQMLARENASQKGPAFALLSARQKLIKVLVLVGLAYVICWTPNQLLFLAINLGANISRETTYYSFFVLLAFSNSVINPFIYALKYKQFRKGFVKVFCRNCRNHNKIGVDETTMVSMAN